MRRAHCEVDDDDGDDADEGENDDENDEIKNGDEVENDGDENDDHLDQPFAIRLPLLQNRAPEKYFFRLSSKRTTRGHLVVCPDITCVHLSSGMVLRSFLSNLREIEEALSGVARIEGICQ